MELWVADAARGLMRIRDGECRKMAPPCGALCALEQKIFCAGPRWGLCLSRETGATLYDFPVPTGVCALAGLGGVILDADAVYHDLTVSSAPMRAEICARFGPVYDGTVLDRKKLGAVVFADQAALADLNAITHKYVDEEVGRRIAQARAEGRPAAAIDAIALIESTLLRYCDCTVAIVAPEDLRVRRIMAREGISEEYARLRVSAQKSSDWFRAHCDYTIESTEADTVETFAKRAQDLFRQILAN